MPFKFESLRIWQKAFDLSDEIHNLAMTFPKSEIFNLTNQIRRAADSVVLNIAEGSTGLSNVEFRRFLNISMRSAFEVVACLKIALKRQYLSEDHFASLYEGYDHLCRMITRFRDGLG